MTLKSIQFITKISKSKVRIDNNNNNKIDSDNKFGSNNKVDKKKVSKNF